MINVLIYADNKDGDDEVTTKESILEMLEQHRGESLSGEQLAGKLGVSRSAVWKAINDLKKDGYRISSVTNKGYCLSDDNDIISAAGIKPFLSDASVAYASRIKIYRSLESTNKTAKELAIAGAEHGTVIISDCQTAGKGRHSHSFFSPPGGLYLSIILRPEVLHFENPTSITAFAAVAVCEAIESISGRSPMIKWVNDIFIDEKKVCGILTEAVTDFESGGLEWIVLGIGINISARTEEFPCDLQASAASLCQGQSIPCIRNKLSAEIINRILGNAASIKEEDVFERYKMRSMILGKQVIVVQDRAEYTATAIDIDHLGRLVVKNGNNETITLSSGEIRI